MKNISRVVMGGLIFTLAIFSIGFVAGEVVTHKKIDLIKQKIPQKWWHGGWDSEAELQSLISPTIEDKHQRAQAQYYIASQYYANREHQRAIQEYRKLISTYPKAWLECQKAQFEIGQINLYRLTEPSAAIYEYQKVIEDYPKSYLKAMAQLMISRAYRKKKDYNNAFSEYEKVIELYPTYHTEVTEASLDIGDMYIEQTFASNANSKLKKQYLPEAIASYKKAYKLCPLTHPELMERALDSIYRAFRCLDMSLVRANEFVKFQKYGSSGMDGIEGTSDDLTDPLEDF